MSDTAPKPENPKFSTMRPVDIADAIQTEPDLLEQQRLFESIDNAATQALTLSELDVATAEQIVHEMPPEDIAALVQELPRDDATDILGILPPESLPMVLNEIPTDEAAQLRRLLQYPKESAGGVMTTRYVTVLDNANVRDAFRAIRKTIGTETNDERVSDVYVIDTNGRLVGSVGLYTLLRLSRSTLLAEIVDHEPIFVTTYTDQEEVAQMVSRYNLLTIPVVDPDHVLVGIITVDDIVDVIQEESTEDLLRMSGISGEHNDALLHTSGILEAGRRLPWLFTNMIGSILAGYVLWFFRLTIQEVVAVITFIPIITALGGNAGLQSSTLVIRSLAMGRINRSDLGRLCARDSWVALLMGVVCGGTTMGVTLLWHGHMMLGVVVGVSMALTFLIAVTMATALPILLKQYGLDPAVAAAPLITTATDIASITIYLALATALRASLM